MQTANIILTGMMGAGKTTVGRDLADKMGKRFVDLDTVVEQRAGTSVQNLFEHYGETRFRQLETAALKAVLSQSDQIVATGGGIVIREENRRLMQRHPVIWLALDGTSASKRLSFDGSRPLLRTDSDVEDGRLASEVDRGMDVWSHLEKERRWAYSLCDWVVDASQRPKAVVEEIMGWYQRQKDAASGGSSAEQPWKAMHLRVDVPDNPYQIHFGWGILGNLGSRCRAEAALKQVLLVSNPTVFELYGSQAVESLQAADLRWDIVLIPDGEEHKHLETVESIYAAAVKAGLDRRSGMIALGGGIVGDVAGFAAASYMRGITLVQVPTTLLAQVDSSVGGKVGVNHPQGKNLIGFFYQPSLVLADLSTLQTLPQRQFLTGMAEIIKCGLIGDGNLLGELERHSHGEVSPSTLTDWVRSSCSLKAKVVAADVKEAGDREILNFGHTVGHALEKVAGYGYYTHGEAVAVGMVTASILSYMRGYLKKSECQRVIELLENWGLPTGIGELSVPDIMVTCRLDKKARSGKMRFVLLENLGSAMVGEVVGEDELAEAFWMQREGGPGC